jgi:hypothetical protein
VQKDVESAELLEDVIDGGSAAFTLTQVNNGTTDGDAVKCTQLVNQRGHPLGALIDHEDTGAGSGECGGARPSEPTRTSYQHATAAQTELVN